MESRSSTLHVAAVGGHIHDAEVMGGSILAKYIAAGHRGTFIHTTPGEKGNQAMAPEDYEKIKVDEALRSAAAIGADCRILPYKDACLPYNRQARLMLAAIFREIRPDIVLTHWRGSFHPDHYRTHALVMDAIEAAADASVQLDHPPHQVTQVFFPENWEDMTGFVPQFYADITSHYEEWHASMMEHGLFRGEVSRFRYKEYYEGLAAARGARAWTQQAVACMRSPFASGEQEMLAANTGEKG